MATTKEKRKRASYILPILLSFYQLPHPHPLFAKRMLLLSFMWPQRSILAPFKYSTSLPPRSISPPQTHNPKARREEGEGKGVLRHRKEERRAPYSAEAKRISLLFFLRFWSRYGRRRKKEEGPSKSLTSPLFSNTACGHETRGTGSPFKKSKVQRTREGRGRRVLINGPPEKR